MNPGISVIAVARMHPQQPLETDRLAIQSDSMAHQQSLVPLRKQNRLVQKESA